MRARWLTARSLRRLLWAGLAMTSAAGAQVPEVAPPASPPEAEAPIPNQSPSESPNESPNQSPGQGPDGPHSTVSTPQAPPTPPPLACYQAARQHGGDAYDCDLAVQVARDTGSSAALAAALTNRALVLMREGRLEPALSDLDTAVLQTPDDPAVHGNRGNLLLRLGRPTEALAAHDRAISLAPQDPRGYYNRAFSYLALGEPLRAEQDVAAARALLERRNAPVRRASRRRAETPVRDGDRFR